MPYASNARSISPLLTPLAVKRKQNTIVKSLPCNRDRESLILCPLKAVKGNRDDLKNRKRENMGKGDIKAHDTSARARSMQIGICAATQQRDQGGYVTG